MTTDGHETSTELWIALYTASSVVMYAFERIPRKMIILAEHFVCRTSIYVAATFFVVIGKALHDLTLVGLLSKARSTTDI